MKRDAPSPETAAPTRALAEPLLIFEKCAETLRLPHSKARDGGRRHDRDARGTVGTDGGAPRADRPPGALTRTQLDTLRHQIAAYSHLCQQNLLLTQQRAEESRPGVQRSATIAAIASSLGVSLTVSQPSYPGPVYSKDGSKPSGQRWSPTQAQLARLEELYATGMGTPNGDLRTQITEELARLGTINEANVYNWFQNKKARMKKKAKEDAEEAARRARMGM